MRDAEALESFETQV